jgi:hypothetical protein
MPHTVESTISYSERDLARGAVDLYEDDIPSTSASLINDTMIQQAVSVVKEAAPRIIETIVSKLVPVVHHHPNIEPGVSVPEQLPEVYFSPPVETIIVVPPSNHTGLPPVVLSQDTVSPL